jgi:hypothetical protein
VLQFEEIATPAPADNEVLIKLYAASVNPLDSFSMRGPLFFLPMIGGLLKPKGEVGKTAPRSRYTYEGVRCILNLPEPRDSLDLPPEIQSWLSSHVPIARGVAHALFELSGRNPRRFAFVQ